MHDTHPVIKAILFDLDNTLLDRDRGFNAFCKSLYHNNSIMGDSHTEEEAVNLITLFDSKSKRSRQVMLTELMKQWPGVFQNLNEAVGFYETNYPKMLTLESSTRTLLQDLRKSGIPSAIVTNGDVLLQTNKVTESGLSNLVEATVISEGVGVQKPNKRIFQKALSLINASPSSTLFVGDTPEADILGAKNIGMITAWVHRNRDWPLNNLKPDYMINHVSDIRNLIPSQFGKINS